MSVPPVTVVVPASPTAPDSVSDPAPDFVSVPVPLMPPPYVVASERLKTTEALLTRFPTIDPVVPPEPIWSVPAVIEVCPE